MTTPITPYVKTEIMRAKCSTILTLDVYSNKAQHLNTSCAAKPFEPQVTKIQDTVHKYLKSNSLSSSVYGTDIKGLITNPHIHTCTMNGLQ